MGAALGAGFTSGGAAFGGGLGPPPRALRSIVSGESGGGGGGARVVGSGGGGARRTAPIKDRGSSAGPKSTSVMPSSDIFAAVLLYLAGWTTGGPCGN